MVRVHFSPPQVALCWVTQNLMQTVEGIRTKSSPKKRDFVSITFFSMVESRKDAKLCGLYGQKRPKMYFALRSKANQTSEGRMYLEN